MFDNTDSFGAAIALVEERQDLLSEALDQGRFEIGRQQSLKDRLQEVRDDMVDSGLIGRPTMDSLSKLGTGLESMQRVFSNYPVASFTQIPSSVNYHPALEGILSSIRNTAVKVIKAIWSFLLSVFKGLHDMWKLSSSSYQKAAQVAKNVEKAQTLTDAIAASARSVEDPSFKGDIDRMWGELTLKMANATSANYNALLNWVLGYNKDVMDAEKLLMSLYQSLRVEATRYLSIADGFVYNLERLGKGVSSSESARITAQAEFISACEHLLKNEDLLVNKDVDALVKAAYGKMKVINPDGITYYQATYTNFLNWVKGEKNTRYQVEEKAVAQVCDATPMVRISLDRANVEMPKIVEVLLQISFRFEKAKDLTTKLVDDERIGDHTLEAAEIVLNRLQSLSYGINSAHSAIVIVINEYLQALRLRTGYIKAEIEMYRKILADKRMDHATRADITNKLQKLRALLTAYEV